MDAPTGRPGILPDFPESGRFLKGFCEEATLSITVRYFASLRESLGKSEEVVDSAEVSRVADVWRQVAGPASAGRVLVAVNHEYADFERVVRDGDEVAFFPPVTGG